MRTAASIAVSTFTATAGLSFAVLAAGAARGRRDRNRRVAEVPVQDEPNGAAFLPHSHKAYVANTASGTVSGRRRARRNAEARKECSLGPKPEVA